MPHSPAPWHNTEHSSDGKHDGHLIVDANGYNVANIWHNQHTATPERIAEQDENADLMTAAPDMFAALHAILFQVIQGKVLERDACITQARAAYAKAKPAK